MPSQVNARKPIRDEPNWVPIKAICFVDVGLSILDPQRRLTSQKFHSKVGTCVHMRVERCGMARHKEKSVLDRSIPGPVSDVARHVHDPALVDLACVVCKDSI